MQAIPTIRLAGTIEDAGVILPWLYDLRRNAHAPDSGYTVSCVAAARVGGGYVLAGGVNVECREQRLSLHGESSAIGALATLFGKALRLEALWTLGAPQGLSRPCADPRAAMPGSCCGACRQHIAEFAAHPDIPIYSASLNGTLLVKPLSVLLPDSFSFSNFKSDIARESIMVPKVAETEKIMRSGPPLLRDIYQWLNALEPIDTASNIPERAALCLKNGIVVAGVKVENAAFTGHGAVQTALGNAVSAFGRIEIQEIYTLGGPLSPAGVESLSPFLAMPAIPVTLFGSGGESQTHSFPETGDMA